MSDSSGASSDDGKKRRIKGRRRKRRSRTRTPPPTVSAPPSQPQVVVVHCPGHPVSCSASASQGAVPASPTTSLPSTTPLIPAHQPAYGPPPPCRSHGSMSNMQPRTSQVAVLQAPPEQPKITVITRLMPMPVPVPVMSRSRRRVVPPPPPFYPMVNYEDMFDPGLVRVVRSHSSTTLL